MSEPPETGLQGWLTDAISSGIAEAVGQVIQSMPGLMGDTPDIAPGLEQTVAGAMAQSQISAYNAMFKHESPGILADWWEDVGSFVYDGLVALGIKRAVFDATYDAMEGKYWKACFTLVTKEIEGWASDWFKDAEAEKDTGGAEIDIWARATKAYTGAVGMGALAHGMAGILSGTILGCGGLRLAGIPAFISKFAGFDDITKAVTGNFYRVYLQEPLRYAMNEAFTPYLPSVGDLMRFRWKRLTNLPVDFKRSMHMWGYSKEWTDVYYDDMFREPMIRDLLLMAESMTATDEWWQGKIERLGYSDDDAPIMVDASKRRAARTQIMQMYTTMFRSCERGYITLDEFTEKVEDLQLSSTAVEYATQGAEHARWARLQDQHLDGARTAYDRDQLTDEEFRDQLDVIYPETEWSDIIFKLTRLKRYKRVYLMAPADVARQSVPLLRQRYIAGSATRAEYETALMESGLNPDVVGLRLAMDGDRRDAQVLREFRQYRLPQLRDALLHGFVTIGEYRGALAAALFPPEYLSAEIALVGAMLKRRREQIVRSEQLPQYRRAYVLGLTGGAHLHAVMTEAGLSAGGIRAEMKMLSWQRADLGRRNGQARAREEAAARQKAAAEAASIGRELATVRVKAQTAAVRWAALKPEEARDQAGDVAARLISEVERGGDADVNRLSELTRSLSDLLWRAKVGAA